MIGSSKLATKFTLLLSLVFISAIVLSGLALSQALEQKVAAEVNYRSQVLAEMVTAIRTYTSTHVNPLLLPKVETEAKFTPEAIPSFAAREIFETVRKNPEYRDLFYKDAMSNPTNLRDKMDPFEAKLVEQFRDSPDLKDLSGFRTIAGDKMFYSARPLSIKDTSCLRCHSTPEKAPKSHIASYGRENGFGWQLNEILGTQIVYVPAKQLFESAHHAFILFIGIFITIFAIVILLINYLLQRNMIQPIKPLAQLAQKISANSINAEEAAEFEQKRLVAIAKRKDELGHLGRVFQTMMHEVYVREQKLKEQVQKLRVQIDETKRAKQIAEIEDSESFQKIQREAQDIRNQWKAANE
jgi:methyl-accepting chemotaxis protein